MGSVTDFSKTLYKTVFDPAGIYTDGGFFDPKESSTPKVKPPEKYDPAEARDAAEAAAERRKRRAIGAFGVTDTYKTGTQGIATGDTVKGTKTLLGG